MRILFQGDSITDCGRRTSGGCGYETEGVGPGYPGLIKSRVLRDHPDRDDIEFVNRAISGNRIGAPHKAPYATNDRAFAIYFDEATNGFTVENNLMDPESIGWNQPGPDMKLRNNHK